METDAYAAGLVDGEGSITLNKRGRFRHPIVSVSSTTPELIDFLYDTYGGSVVVHKVYRKHHKPSWVWSVRYWRAISFLERITPFMKEPLKLYRAHLILSEYHLVTNRNGKYTDEEVERKLDFESRFFHPSNS